MYSTSVAGHVFWIWQKEYQFKLATILKTGHYDREIASPRADKRKLKESDRVRMAIIDARTTEYLAVRAKIFHYQLWLQASVFS